MCGLWVPQIHQGPQGEVREWPCLHHHLEDFIVFPHEGIHEYVMVHQGGQVLQSSAQYGLTFQQTLLGQLVQCQWVPRTHPERSTRRSIVCNIHCGQSEEPCSKPWRPTQAQSPYLAMRKPSYFSPFSLTWVATDPYLCICSYQDATTLEVTSILNFSPPTKRLMSVVKSQPLPVWGASDPCAKALEESNGNILLTSQLTISNNYDASWEVLQRCHQMGPTVFNLRCLTNRYRSHVTLL